MKIQEIPVKSVMTKSNLPVSDYSVNPYVGCTHACQYCYASFMKRFTNHPEPWGEFIDVKTWPEIKHPEKYAGKEAFLCSVTDPYQPIDAKYKRTRALLDGRDAAKIIQAHHLMPSIVADADLSPERWLQGTKGQGLATYRELISNLSTKTKPEGGALTLILDRWISAVQSEAMQETGLSPDDPALSAATDRKIYAVTASVSELVHGFEFGRLLSAYYGAYVNGDDETKAKVVRWFRGEYTTKTEAKEALGVNIIITDDDWYDYLKLFAAFFRLAGYAGMFIMIDELVNIYKIPNSITRQYNYEKLLTMYNDTLQGKAKYLGILMGSTPQALEDKRRGIYSYEALRSRLAEGRFSKPGARDLLAPVIRLEPLTAEEMLVLCEKLAEMHAGLYGYSRSVTTEDLVAFIKIEYGRIGADQNITPREVIRDFIELMDLLYQNPKMDITALLSSDEFSYAKSEAVPG